MVVKSGVRQPHEVHRLTPAKPAFPPGDLHRRDADLAGQPTLRNIL
jgi:hypothetical protein